MIILIVVQITVESEPVTRQQSILTSDYDGKPHFTSTVGSGVCSVVALQGCLCATHVHVGQCPRNQLHAKDADMEKAL